MFQSFTIVLGVIFCFVNGDVINYDNIRRFMSQSPDDLAKTLQLLENPYIAAALVNSNKKQQKEPAKTYPMEESNNLLNFLLSQRIGDSSRTNYKIENPSLALVPPIVNAKGIEEDPLLGSFFKDTMEDQTPLEIAKNKDVPIVQNRQTEREAKEHHASIQYNKPVHHQQSEAYFYLPPSAL